MTQPLGKNNAIRENYHDLHFYHIATAGDRQFEGRLAETTMLGEIREPSRMAASQQDEF